MTSCSFAVLLAEVKYRVAVGVARGRLCVVVGLGVEGNVNRGVALNCCVLGPGVCCANGVCLTVRSLTTNRWGDGVTDGGAMVEASCREVDVG